MIDNTEASFIAIYVDNITLYGPSGLILKNIKNTLKYEFDIMDLGDFHWLLGIPIRFRLKGIELSLTVYIDSIISSFGLQECNPTIPLIDWGTIFTRSDLEDVIKDIKISQSMIGSILYLVTITQPDLTFAISFLTQFSSVLIKQHVADVKHCL
jgi:hypothetical protein